MKREKLQNTNKTLNTKNKQTQKSLAITGNN